MEGNGELLIKLSLNLIADRGFGQLNEPQVISGGRHSSALEAQWRALTDSAGFRLLEDRTVVRVTGDDRVTFFHGMCSADVKGARPGSILPALFLTEHAHVIADLFIWVEEDALMLETGRSEWPREREHLDHLLVADDVEMEEVEGTSILHVEGTRAAEMLAEIEISGAAAMAPWSCSKSVNCVMGRVPRFGADAFSLLGDHSVLRGIAQRLQSAGATAVDPEALDIVRVEHGLAKPGIDMTEKTIALEARLEPAISFNKGCYLGQETVERATARGALKKRLFGLRLERRIEPGASLMLAGKEVGRATSPVLSPRFGPIALAILHHSAWNPGMVLEARDSGGKCSATVSEIPFS